MHPYLSAETARLHRLELEREAALHCSTRIGRPASAPGLLTQARSRLADGIARADAGIRQQLGLALIRVGLRIVDPPTTAPARVR